LAKDLAQADSAERSPPSWTGTLTCMRRATPSTCWSCWHAG